MHLEGNLWNGDFIQLQVYLVQTNTLCFFMSKNTCWTLIMTLVENLVASTLRFAVTSEGRFRKSVMIFHWQSAWLASRYIAIMAVFAFHVHLVSTSIPFADKSVHCFCRVFQLARHTYIPKLHNLVETVPPWIVCAKIFPGAIATFLLLNKLSLWFHLSFCYFVVVFFQPLNTLILLQ